jgi:hypothetical protein
LRNFLYKNIHKIIHQSQQQIDHIQVEGKDFHQDLDIRSFRNAPVGSDHYLVRGRFQESLPKKMISTQNPKTTKYNLSKLRNENAGMEYGIKIKSSHKKQKRY